jgi:uncharacterized membrane protein YeaQ/YmgE (transglycosylase-associated protein family)
MNSFIASLFIGLIAGWLAGLLRRGKGFGLFGNILIGLIGSVVGSFVAGLFGINDTNLLGSVLISTFGAVILLGILSFFGNKSV